MPSWRDDYLNALVERDRKEKANQSLYHDYTKLADRTATLQAAHSIEAVKSQGEPFSSPESKDRTANRDKRTVGGPKPTDTIMNMRQDLAEAQRSRGMMETRLQDVIAEVNKLKIQSSLDTKRISELMKEKTTLTTGMRDRDEELRGKAKLLEDVHDETVSLTLQLSMAEEQSEKLKHENRDLVDRWMARMGKEADALNDESRFS